MTVRQALTCAILLAAVGGCAKSTQLSNVWVDDYWTGEPIDNVLVIGVTHRTEIRQAFEDRFVKEFERENIRAVSSASELGVGRIDSLAIMQYVAEHEIDAILVTHLLKVTEELTYVPGATYTPGANTGGFYRYYTWGMNSVTTPGYMDQAEVVRLETNVYLSNSRLLWSGITDSFNPGSEDDVIKSLPEAVITDLYKRRMLP